MSTVSQMKAVFARHGSDAQFHRNASVTPCPCLTPEGFRDPEWHDANPDAPVCDEAGFLSDPSTTTDLTVKAFVQPAQSTRATRMNSEYLQSVFGEIETDDHIGVFPCVWKGVTLDFKDWSQAADEYVEYAGSRFLVVNANLIPDPSDGNPFHHWEVGLRLISND